MEKYEKMVQDFQQKASLSNRPRQACYENPLWQKQPRSIPQLYQRSSTYMDVHQEFQRPVGKSAGRLGVRIMGQALHLVLPCLAFIGRTW